jgi:hypothetical protein
LCKLFFDLLSLPTLVAELILCLVTLVPAAVMSETTLTEDAVVQAIATVIGVSQQRPRPWLCRASLLKID